jgi:hypothetical protein
MAPIFGFSDFIAMSYFLINPADNFTVRSPKDVAIELYNVVKNPVFLGKPSEPFGVFLFRFVFVFFVASPHSVGK